MVNRVSLMRYGPGWLGVGAAIFGSLFAFGEVKLLNDKTIDDRSANSIQFIMAYQEEGFRDVRKTMYDHVFRGEPISEIDEFAFIEFFDVSYICVEENLCNEEVLANVFSAYANYHWPCLKARTIATRELEEGQGISSYYGKGLENYVTVELGDDHCLNRGPGRTR
ncbi:MAG: hypothetical protein CMK09_10290 [Ponticaulis sp.]|nr:hypothetical protein [Ponticaulis sp.]|tara:strand:+ start:6483 stop:6980 length:498 start_codon:yes stop_codon:yes gene_type:complete